MIAEQLTEQVYNCIKCGLCVNVCPVYRATPLRGSLPEREGAVDQEDPGRGIGALAKFFPSSLYLPPLRDLHRGLPWWPAAGSSYEGHARAEIIDQFGLPWQKRALFHLLSGDLLLPFPACLGADGGNSLASSSPGRERWNDPLSAPPAAELKAAAQTVSGRCSPTRAASGPSAVFRRLRHELSL